MSWIDLPASGSLTLGNAAIPSGLLSEPPPTPPDPESLVRLDLRIEAGRITAIAPRGTLEGATDLAGRQLWPCLVDTHTHLDKGHIWPRAQNPDGSFEGAINAVRADRDAHWSDADIEARFAFGLACSYAHGTTAIRTHIDTYPGIYPRSWAVFRKLRDAWAGRIALQASSISTMDVVASPDGTAIADEVARSGGVLGFVTRISGEGHHRIPPGFHEMMDHAFRLAMERDLDLDLHVDESEETAAATLALIAETSLRLGFKGRIQAGHCCSLALQPEAEIARTLHLLREANIAVVSLPMCNMYLQDRARRPDGGARTPRWRGVTLLHELAAAGIDVSVASDNCRDPFYGYGDHDLLEVYREATRIAHLDHPIGNWPRSVASTPASVMRLPDFGRIAVGGPADLILFRARGMRELLSRHQSDRVVLRSGRPIDTTLPAYETLDALQGIGGA